MTVTERTYTPNKLREHNTHHEKKKKQEDEEKGILVQHEQTEYTVNTYTPLLYDRWRMSVECCDVICALMFFGFFCWQIVYYTWSLLNQPKHTHTHAHIDTEGGEEPCKSVVLAGSYLRNASYESRAVRWAEGCAAGSQQGGKRAAARLR